MTNSRARSGMRFAFHALVALGALLALGAPPCAAADPVESFIATADSLSRLAEETPLVLHVRKYPLLAGAAVEQLLDGAIKAGDGGDRPVETRSIELASRIAHAHADAGVSSAPLDLVKIYRGWNARAREERRRAKDLETRSTEARNAREYARAAKLLREANAIYVRLKDAYSEAVAYGSLGIVHWYAGDYDAVLADYERALAARRAIDNRILEGRTLNGLGSTYAALERFGEAIDRFALAADLRRKTGDLAGLGTTLTYLGNAYLRAGRLDEAGASYEEALPILESTGAPRQRAELLNSMATLYGDQGRLAASNDAYRRALDIALAGGDAAMELSCRMNLAVNDEAAFRFRDALEEYERVERLLAASPDPAQSILLRQNRGVLQLKLGEMEAARDDFLAALRLSREHGAPSNEIAALVNVGYLYRDLGAFDRARAAADTALFRAQQEGNGPAGREAHHLAAEIERVAGRYDASLEHWYRALEIDRSTNAATNVLGDGVGIANVNALMGKADEARSLYLGLLPRVREAGSRDLELSIWFGVGHTFERSNPDSARFYYDRALATIERTRAGLGGAESGASFLGGERRSYYEEIARFYGRVARETGNAAWSARAFETIEAAKARGLLDIVEASLAGTARNASAADVSSAARSFAGADLLVGIAETQGAIPKNGAMLVYALGDSASLLWAIDRKGFELHELPGRAALAQDVELLRSAVASPGTADDELRRLSRKLYRALVEPVEKRIAKRREIVVVPDGALFEIPFELLLEKEPRDGAWKAQPFLALRHPIVYAPSASMYRAIAAGRAAGTYRVDLVALGDPDYASCRAAAGPALRPLPFTGAEIEGIAARFKPDRCVVRLGADASEAALGAELAAGSPRLLHIAAHGFADPSNPALSRVALCADSLAGDDGNLTTLEIMALPLRSRLVVLSACESGRGRIGRSEGVVGLTRAFLAAGAGGVVSSLWSVSDASTARLMKELYGRMAGKKKPACVALAEARRALIDDPTYGHPFYWSAFVVTGAERAPW